jgi:hypothetical protein
LLYSYAQKGNSVQAPPAKAEGKKLRFSFKGMDGVLTSFSGTDSETFFSGVLSISGEPDQRLKLPAQKVSGSKNPSVVP